MLVFLLWERDYINKHYQPYWITYNVKATMNAASVAITLSVTLTHALTAPLFL